MENQLSGGLQPSLVLVAILHVRRRIEHQGRRHGGLLSAGRAGQFHARTGQGEGQQCNHTHSQQQQQQVPQLQPPLVRVVPLLEEPQGGKLQQRRLAAHDQVQNDRHRDQCASG